MKLSRFALMTAAIIVASAGTASAQDGFYIGLQGGYNSSFGPYINEDCVFCDQEATAELDGGSAIGVVAGVRMEGGVRFELEATRRNNSFLSIDWSDAERATEGDVRSFAYMANVMVDLYPGPMRPYVGFGLGAATVDFRNIRDANGLLVDGTRTVFAGQAMAGVSADLGPGTQISAEYRFFATTEAHLRFDGGQRAAIAGRSADFEYRNNTLMIGIRQSF